LSSHNKVSIGIRPFLKWAGGKYRLLERIKTQLPSGNRLIEPFVGSGAVFLNTDYDKYLLGDINPDLINLYGCLKDEGEGLSPTQTNGLVVRRIQKKPIITGEIVLIIAKKSGKNPHCFYT